MRRLSVLLIFTVLLGCASPPPQLESPVRIQAQTMHRNALQAIRDGRIESAAQYWRAAMQAYQSIDDWQGQGMARLGLAQVQQRLGQGAGLDAEQTLVPMLQNAAFTQLHRSQANFQMAQLFAADDVARAAQYLAESRQLCASPCGLAIQQANLSAKLALQQGVWDEAERWASLALFSLGAESPAEVAHSQRVLAEAALARSQYDVALVWLEKALLLDQQSAEPTWLLDDYRLMLRIAQQKGDSELSGRAQARLDSLCAALDCAGLFVK